MLSLTIALAIGSGFFHNGNPSPSFSGVPDVTAPETTLSDYPTNPTGGQTASFAFASDDLTATFACNLDGAGYSACTSPKTYSGPLAFGSHTFLVRATDPAGNTDSSPASHAWMITFSNAKSISFAGDDDIVALGQPSDMNFTIGVSKYTVSAWFKRGAAADYDRDMVTHATQGGGGTTNFILRATSTDTVQTYVGGGQNAIGTSGDTAGFVHGWHHVVSAVSGPTGKLYLDGRQVGSDFAVGVSQSDTMDWLIGASRYDSNADTGFPFSGKIDEVSFWNVALNATEVTELFNSGDPAACNLHSKGANLIHWYRMGDNDTYPTIHDEAGSQNGTATNMAGAANINTDVPIGLDVLTCVAASGCEQLVIDDWDGSSGTWTARVGSNNGTKRGTPTQGNSSNFMGRKYVTFANNNDCMTIPGDEMTSSSFQRSYEVVIDTHTSTTGSGQYLMSRTNPGNTQLINFFFRNNSTAFDSAIYTSGAAAVWLGNSSGTIANLDARPLVITITMDTTAPRYTFYVNGTQNFQDTTTTGSLTTATTQALGLGCRWTQSAASTEHFNGRILEFLRHNTELSSSDVSSRLTQFNNLKGY